MRIRAKVQSVDGAIGLYFFNLEDNDDLQPLSSSLNDPKSSLILTIRNPDSTKAHTFAIESDNIERSSRQNDSS